MSKIGKLLTTGDIVINNIIQLYKLINTMHYKHKTSSYKKKHTAIVLDILSYIFTIALLTVVCYVLQIIGGYDGQLEGVLSFCIFIFMCAIFVYALSAFNKIFGATGDLEQMASLPMSPRQIFVAKFLVVATKIYSLTLYVVAPVFVALGIITRAGISYYLLIVPTMAVFPLLPMGLALIVAVPVILFKTILGDMPMVYLVAFCTLMVAFFIIYSQFIFLLADYLLFDKMPTVNPFLSILLSVAGTSVVTTAICDILLATNILVGLAINIGIGVAVMTSGLAVFWWCFPRLTDSMLNKRHILSTAPAKPKKKSPFFALMDKEHKSIMRNSDYLASVVGLAIVAPVFMYICNSFIVSAVTEQLGEGMNLATSVLVLLMFSSMICAPSASFISKDGMMFFYTKLFPISYTRVFVSKGLMAVVWAMVSALWSTAVMCIFGFVTVWQSLAILVINLVFSIGLIHCGVCINMVKPNLHTRTSKDNSNVVILMLIGASISTLSSLVVFVFSKSLSYLAQLGILLGVAVIFCAICVLIFARINKTYINRIGQ